jgi:nucleotide-binding universal stress UspA family protein
MKNILVLIHDDNGQEARLQAALDLTRALNSHLTCVDLTIIPEVVGDYIGTTGVLFGEEQEREAKNRRTLLERLSHEDVSYDWIDRTGFVAQTIEQQAGLTDLIVLGREKPGTLFPHMVDVIGDLLFRLAKPILIVPPESRPLNLFGQVLIAWDGSRNAEAALQAAMPLLGHAENVTLFYVDDGSLVIPVEEAARYLSRHGIEPMIRREAAGSARPGKAILTEAGRGLYDLIVMGAYSRSRTIETIFGGASRSLLEQATAPVFMAHRG